MEANLGIRARLNFIAFQELSELGSTNLRPRDELRPRLEYLLSFQIPPSWHRPCPLLKQQTAAFTAHSRRQREPNHCRDIGSWSRWGAEALGKFGSAKHQADCTKRSSSCQARVRKMVREKRVSIRNSMRSN